VSVGTTRGGSTLAPPCSADSDVCNPNLFIDVTDKFDVKLAALRKHDSQVAHMDNLDELITGWLTMQAEVAGFEAGRLAEVFRQVRLPD